MGNTASTAVVKSLEGRDIFSLTDAELHVLLYMHAFSKYEIQQVSKSLKPIDIQSSGFYSKDDTPETDLAVRLNHLCPELAKLRFQMVPSLLKEPIFWESVFTILRERLVEHNAKFQLQRLEAEDANGGGGSTSSNGQPSAQNDALVKALRDQLAAKEKEIVELQNQVAMFQAALANEPITHVGTWVMDKDSQEFLDYPEEVKENMRKEKQRRLRQVQQDMNFILDSDSIEHSNGHWSCCGGKDYHASCPKSYSR